jgi:predicted lysophospholipase L1 biosynthesis ABC-type transport system permease subunit
MMPVLRKVLGAPTRNLPAIFRIEYGALGTSPAVIAQSIASGATSLVITQVMRVIGASFPQSVVLSVLDSLTATVSQFKLSAWGGRIRISG